MVIINLIAYAAIYILMRGHALLLRAHAIIMRAHAMTNACPRNEVRAHAMTNAWHA